VPDNRKHPPLPSPGPPLDDDAKVASLKKPARQDDDSYFSAFGAALEVEAKEAGVSENELLIQAQQAQSNYDSIQAGVSPPEIPAKASAVAHEEITQVEDWLSDLVGDDEVSYDSELEACNAWDDHSLDTEAHQEKRNKKWPPEKHMPRRNWHPKCDEHTPAKRFTLPHKMTVKQCHLHTKENIACNNCNRSRNNLHFYVDPSSKLMSKICSKPSYGPNCLTLHKQWGGDDVFRC